MSPVDHTRQNLIDSSLFNSDKEKVYLKVVKNREGEKSLSLTRPSFFERILAYFGFGPASLKEVNKFLNSSEGQKQVKDLLNSPVDTEKQLIYRNLEILHNKMEKKWGLGKVFTLTQAIFPQPTLTSKGPLPSPQSLLVQQKVEEAEKEKAAILPELNAWVKAKSSSPIATNLAQSRPSWLPKAAVTPKGTLSLQNFNYLVFNKLNPSEKEEVSKWMFEQRKFPAPSFADTIMWDPKIKNLATAPEDQEGYATSISHHGPHTALFIEDNYIKQIEGVRTLRTQNHYHQTFSIGIYEDGKTMIPQQAVRGCVAACAAMLIEDHQKSCNVGSLYSTNLADGKRLIGWLQEAGLDGKEHTVKEGIKELNEIIEKHGSVACSVSGDIGNHEIILDHIDKDQATIRDPFHGWRVTVPTSYFFQMAGNSPTIVYVTSSETKR